VWSVKIAGEPRVYPTRFVMKDVRFVVRPAGRRKTVETGARSVHAFAVGTVWTVTPCRIPFDGRVGYNPFRNESFVDTRTGRPVHQVAWASFNPDGTVDIIS
jgi:hypothetical protein